MLYDGKQASLDLQSELQSRIKKLSHTPVLAIISIATHPSITSFIKIIGWSSLPPIGSLFTCDDVC
jgi:hypothetical protein